MTQKVFVLMTAVLVLAASCTGVSYKDCSAPVEKRVEDLLSRMTLEEKVGQMNQFVGLDMMEQTGNTIVMNNTAFVRNFVNCCAVIVRL